MRLAIVCLVAGLVLAQAPTRTVWDGVYTAEQAKRGEAAYASQCARCHGTQLTGGESAPPLAGIEFLSNWNGLSVGELFERIRVSMPADRPGRLTRTDNADIIAFMFSVGEFPAGKSELASREEALGGIEIQMYKPEP